MDYIVTTLDNLGASDGILQPDLGKLPDDRSSLYLSLPGNLLKGFEPLLLTPIAFGMLLVNIYPDIMLHAEDAANGVGGLLYYFYKLDSGQSCRP